MRSRSDLWKEIVADGEFQMETVVRIYGATGDDENALNGPEISDGVPEYKEYSTITAPVISRSLFSGDKISVGNCNAGMLNFTLMTTDTIPRAAKIIVLGRPYIEDDSEPDVPEEEQDTEPPVTQDDETEDEPETDPEDDEPEEDPEDEQQYIYGEWMEFGTFWVDSREVNEDLIDIEAYDAMMMGNQVYSDNSEGMNWPKTISEVVTRIKEQMQGIENDVPTGIIDLDDRTKEDIVDSAFGHENKIVTLPKDDDTLLDLLKYIGEVAGGNWTITPDNKLRFVPLTSIPAVTNYIVDNQLNRITTDQGENLVWRDNPIAAETENQAGGELFNVPVVIGSITTANNYIVTKVTMTKAGSAQNASTSGDDSDDGVEYDQASAWSFGNSDGFELVVENNPYATEIVCRDLYNAVGGIEYAPFAIENSCFDPAAELSDWIIVGETVRSVLCSMVQTFDVNYRADASAPGEDETESEYPFKSAMKRLEYRMANAEAGIYSKIEQTRGGISATVGDLSDRLKEAESKLTITSQSIGGYVKRGELISSFVMEPEGSKIDTKYLDIDSYVTFTNLRDNDGKTRINGGNIETHSLSANALYGGCMTLGGVNNENGWIKLVDKTGTNEIGRWDSQGIQLSSGKIKDAEGNSSWDLDTGNMQLSGTFTSIGSTWTSGDDGVGKTYYKTELSNGLITFSIRDNSTTRWTDMASVGYLESFIEGLPPTVGLMPAGRNDRISLNAETESGSGASITAYTNGNIDVVGRKIYVGGDLAYSDTFSFVSDYNANTSKIKYGEIVVKNGFIVSVSGTGGSGSGGDSGSGDSGGSSSGGTQLKTVKTTGKTTSYSNFDLGLSGEGYRVLSVYSTNTAAYFVPWYSHSSKKWWANVRDSKNNLTPNTNYSVVITYVLCKGGEIV